MQHATERNRTLGERRASGVPTGGYGGSRIKNEMKGAQPVVAVDPGPGKPLFPDDPRAYEETDRSPVQNAILRGRHALPEDCFAGRHHRTRMLRPLVTILPTTRRPSSPSLFSLPPS